MPQGDYDHSDPVTVHIQRDRFAITRPEHPLQHRDARGERLRSEDDETKRETEKRQRDAQRGAGSGLQDRVQARATPAIVAEQVVADQH